MRTTTLGLIFVTYTVFQISLADEENVIQIAAFDSYLDAYRESQEANEKSVKVVDGVIKKSDKIFDEWNPQQGFNGFGPSPQ